MSAAKELPRRLYELERRELVADLEPAHTLHQCESKEETVLSIRLDNAKRDALGTLDLLARARIEANQTERYELANDLEDLRILQQQVSARLIAILEAEGEKA